MALGVDLHMEPMSSSSSVSNRRRNTETALLFGRKEYVPTEAGVSLGMKKWVGKQRLAC